MKILPHNILFCTCIVVDRFLLVGNSLPEYSGFACSEFVAGVFWFLFAVNSLPEYSNSFGGNPVSCAMGAAVLEVIHNERLLISASVVGRDLRKRLDELAERHPKIGQVRGVGLSLVIDMVTDKVKFAQ